MPLPIVAITAGDPAGIGPEVTIKALKEPSVYKLCRPVVVGSAGMGLALRAISRRFPVQFVEVLPQGKTKFVPGIESAGTGAASFEYILTAVGLIKSKRARALVTAPISKAAFHMAGKKYSGHTELLAELTKTKNYAMMMAAQNLRAVMVTRHLPVSDVPSSLNADNIIRACLLADDFLKKYFRFRKPRLGVCALNPHAGEGGHLGGEENIIILPAVKRLVKRGLSAQGPLPNDSAWLKMKNGLFDLLVCMYHDQVMTPLKCLAAEKIVNITLGLPFVRTSPGHGTAFDIAGRNIADESSMIEAIKTAALLAR
ncbi:MAG TPA: 4-hydroxythreonine-4-phosphate dehydrogenase PdxA [Elusimicrobia bacterium]|nr:MAG: 4-hydroxythreonine-4-phosphate dehydrogenase PdxA [Elusimicrobia bacterium RIFOXYA12_FULL_49_49]OGS10103.1 MAG: 4-hydroxythreonine-4-phosphate dehydrogenase PdxA [Elusimicrobia bacterium RIFOXYA1_FULL_47_7]OGS11874.1 MAG: 4-hydroxythreonine-4-phosphate dehydrogenase PdxA [Elusimicrobia bacterium RIFOXYB1_FULL_48_9]OGS16277.1 MAG: 4-hydroxythreonine-4-phosphate dehydrogenase PdxA [Elusimicrobia bacterium RIFOXYA2_FULL_47_53]OGS26181.1 MAG: 4-hydroxythreonine-4-phosphate dehydrogenase Pdx